MAEGDTVEVAAAVRSIVKTLDARGILQSIASRNDSEAALRKLQELDLEDYFLVPEIHWGNKSGSIARIAERLNIGLDAIAFVDDQPFERDEVASCHPMVLCLTPEALPDALGAAAFNPPFVTDEARQRRLMYRADFQRQDAEERFEGPAEVFLASLGLRLHIAAATETDLPRLEELTSRTHQLNTTGRIYSFEELGELLRSCRHQLLVARLDDRYGGYGTIGLALVERLEDSLKLTLLLMSCRVMSRGVGSLLLHHVMRTARDLDLPLLAEIKPNERNRMMYATFRFSGFTETGEQHGVKILRHSATQVPEPPHYIQVITYPCSAWR